MAAQSEAVPSVKRPNAGLVVPSLQVGAASGLGGVMWGATVGALKTEYSLLFTTIAGAQWFIFGTSFYYCRSILIDRVAHGQPTKSQELMSSGCAGATSGALVGALRSRSNIIPAAIVMSIFGLGGQGFLHALPGIMSRRKTETDGRPIMQRIVESPWMPFRPIPDKDYEIALSEKLMQIDAELASVEEQITILRLKAQVNNAPA